MKTSVVKLTSLSFPPAARLDPPHPYSGTQENFRQIAREGRKEGWSSSSSPSFSIFIHFRACIACLHHLAPPPPPGVRDARMVGSDRELHCNILHLVCGFKTSLREPSTKDVCYIFSPLSVSNLRPSPPLVRVWANPLPLSSEQMSRVHPPLRRGGETWVSCVRTVTRTQSEEECQVQREICSQLE